MAGALGESCNNDKAAVERPGYRIVEAAYVENSLLPGPSGLSFGCVDIFNQLGKNVGPFINTRGTTLPFVIY